MKQFMAYLLVAVCSFAILMNFLRIIRLIFKPKFMSHPVFDFPSDGVRRGLLLACGVIVLLLVILNTLGYLECE
jgi:uncharacterized membrane protein (DUF485 family)